VKLMQLKLDLFFIDPLDKFRMCENGKENERRKQKKIQEFI
jgi:hypothetical protein